MNPEYQRSEQEPETLSQMAAMFGTEAMPTPTTVAMQRAQKIVNDLKFEIKRITQTETEIPRERIKAVFDETISRCRSEILVPGIQAKTIANLETIRNALLSPTGG